MPKLSTASFIPFYPQSRSEISQSDNLIQPEFESRALAFFRRDDG